MYRKLVGVMLGMIIILSGCMEKEPPKTEAILFVEKMGNGWNLGNSLDVYKLDSEYTIEEYETYWGNPITTKEMIMEVKRAGFDTIRIPVSWTEHIDETGKISLEWMNRVQEVVDYAYFEDMYVILDAHHEKWAVPSYENKEYALEMIESIWSQVALRFEEYDQRLIFEGLNEPRLRDTEFEWNEGTFEARKIINEFNEAFVNTIRNSSGYNKKRFLMIPTYCNNSEEEVLNDFVVPKDSRIIISIHEYVPYRFASKEEEKNTWSSSEKEDTKEIDSIMKRLNEKFCLKGIPVIISEFACGDKDNLEYRIQWTEYYVKKAFENGINCIWWDDGGKTDEEGGYRIFDRYSLTWSFPEIKEKILMYK